MQPIDQAVTIFMAAVFVIFSLGLAYATWLGGTEKKNDGKKQ
jgi:preprotein translocase subunit SecG